MTGVQLGAVGLILLADSVIRHTYIDTEIVQQK